MFKYFANAKTRKLPYEKCLYDIYSMCEKTLTTQPNPKPDLNAKVIFSTGRFIIINERIIK